MQYSANLEGSQQVPPVSTPARGQARFRVNDDNTQISYRLNVKNIQRFFQSHIHLGRRGTNGPVVAPMFNSTPGITVSDVQIMGTITRGDLTGPMEGRTIADLVDEMNAGNTYVNVHTERHPDGEIRGQIRRTDRD